MSTREAALLSDLDIVVGGGNDLLEGVYGGSTGGSGAIIESLLPASGKPLARIRGASLSDYDGLAEQAVKSFRQWREIPAPARGEFVRRVGEALREKKSELGRLVTLECGKLLSEGEGEVQEMIDIADFAVGLSRQLYGLSMHSERPGHRMYEQWHPLGPVGVVSAFNFPVAVWAWNAMIAFVCGDSVIWKPSEKTPLSAIAVHSLTSRVSREMGLPEVSYLACGGADIARAMAGDRRLPLISATGSCDMGRALGPIVAGRLGRSLLELGGNNATIVTADADLELALRAVTFAAVGTAGQRCTTLRRVILEDRIAVDFTEKLTRAYASMSERIGDPLESETLVGPLVSADAVEAFEQAIERARAEGGEILAGGRRVDPKSLPAGLGDGYYVEPTLVRAHPDMPVLREETFAPILYVLTVSGLDEAIALQNDVDQGLSSAIFTNSLRSSERFLGAAGSDCGIANVNIGTSGAEIGGAFGGEKDTGGGREAGSDSWKAYMRRQTCTINGSDELPLAQGVEFEL